MRNNIRTVPYDLQLFGGVAADGAAPAAAPGGGNLPKTAEPGGSSHRHTGAEETGAAAAAGGPDAGDKDTRRSSAEKRKAFQALIEGEYREQYAEAFQQTFNRRHREAGEMKASLAAQQPIIDLLMDRCGIEDGDLGKLYRKLESASKQPPRSTRAQLANARTNGWLSEAAALQQRYPDFDLAHELGRREFQSMLRAGVPVRRAYEVLHLDRLQQAAAKHAARTVSRQMEAKLREKADRPSENGIASQTAVNVRSGVHGMTRADRAEVIRRAQRGEKITF